MIARYLQIRTFLPSLDSSEVDDMSLTTTENRRVEAPFESLRVFEPVAEALQCDNTTLSDARTIFDVIIDAHLDCAVILSSTGNIVKYPGSESVIVRIQRDSVSALTRAEHSKLHGFIINGASESVKEDSQLSFVERALKRQRIPNQAYTDKYVDTRYLLATLNICERLFSRVGYVLNERRKGLTPLNLEAQIFLYMNGDLWYVHPINGLQSALQ